MSTIHRIWCGTHLHADNLTVFDLTPLVDGTYLAYDGTCYEHDTVSIDSGIIDHYMKPRFMSLGNGTTYRQDGSCPAYCLCRKMDRRRETPSQPDVCPYVQYWGGAMPAPLDVVIAGLPVEEGFVM